MLRALRPAALTFAVLCWGALARAGPGSAGVEWRGWNDGLQHARTTQRPIIVDV